MWMRTWMGECSVQHSAFTIYHSLGWGKSLLKQLKNDKSHRHEIKHSVSGFQTSIFPDLLTVNSSYSVLSQQLNPSLCVFASWSHIPCNSLSSFFFPLLLPFLPTQYKFLKLGIEGSVRMCNLHVLIMAYFTTYIIPNHRRTHTCINVGHYKMNNCSQNMAIFCSSSKVKHNRLWYKWSDHQTIIF